MLLIVTAFTVSEVWAQQIQAAEPFHSDEESVSKMDAFLAQWDNPEMPGCAIGAVRDGELIYKRAFGMAHLDHNVPNTTSTLFNLASVSKQFTAMSVALLAQQGKLSLDDDIRKHVPELPNYGETITIRHLLHHSSGIRDYQTLMRLSGLETDNAYNANDILNILARQKNISFRPGSKYQYSNSGYFLLGVIVERASGKSLRAFAKENIFEPLGMKNTLFSDNRFEVVKNRAHGYKVGPDKSIAARSTLFDPVGDSGLFTTVEDLFLWDQNFYEPKVGGKELIELLTTPGVLRSGEKMDYAFGLVRSEYKGLPIVHHGGNLGSGFRAYIMRFPEQTFTAMALCNNTAIAPIAIVQKLGDIYLEGRLRPAATAPKSVAPALPPTSAVSQKDAELYAGVYADVASGKVIRLSVKDGDLVESAIFGKDVPVAETSKDRLIVQNGSGLAELNLVRSESGAISEIKMITTGGEATGFVPVKPAPESLEQMAEYVGTYYSEELNAEYTISLKGKNLVVKVSDSLQPSLTPEYADSFSSANGQINFSFERDDKETIIGFVFNAGLGGRDVKGVFFQRK